MESRQQNNFILDQPKRLKCQEVDFEVFVEKISNISYSLQGKLRESTEVAQTKMSG